ncbi:MAG: geranylgeranyl hydrogenase BchP [Saprospiraceae bacterium]|nr:MAG: geranylgeranyl hydrogenase BchP [Saprospiraceae bacterium]
MSRTTDICIVGAGPAGAATALKLSYMGIPSILIDKATFPRDKICGDAISGKVTTLLNRLDPEILKRFNGLPIQSDIWGIRFITPNGKALDIPFPVKEMEDEKAPGYISRRIDFDHFLVEEVKKRENIHFYEGVAIENYERSERGWQLSSKEGELVVDTKLLIVANGAHSAFSRKIAGLPKENKHHAGAIRAYYKNVYGFEKSSFIELHFLKKLTPGYFWIFPLPNGHANVGLGMRSDFISNRKFNLKKAFFDILESHPEFKERFAEAELLGTIQGYGLPLGSKTRPISGDHFMLIGDAGHLIDPLTGEGIGNGMYSGFIAAEQAEQCLTQNDFSAEILKAYDVRVARVLGKEMKLSYQLQQMMRFVPLVNFLSTIFVGNQKFLNVLTRMYTDFNLREQLVKPWFWLKMWFGKEGTEIRSEKSEVRKNT